MVSGGLLRHADDDSRPGMPAVWRMVGATSMMWWNCERRPPLSAIRFGQLITIGLRVPPKCDASCLVHWS
jgi:hypothetical protein